MPFEQIQNTNNKNERGITTLREIYSTSRTQQKKSLSKIKTAELDRVEWIVNRKFKLEFEFDALSPLVSVRKKCK